MEDTKEISFTDKYNSNHRIMFIYFFINVFSLMFILTPFSKTIPEITFSIMLFSVMQIKHTYEALSFYKSNEEEFEQQRKSAMTFIFYNTLLFIFISVPSIYYNPLYAIFYAVAFSAFYAKEKIKIHEQ